MVAALYAGFYHLDLLVGYGLPVLVLLLGRSYAGIGSLFWLGVVIGLLWEIPIFVMSGADVGLPLITFVRTPPVHWLFFLVGHTLWDGGLFLVGIGLIHLLCPAPVLRSFAGRELAVLLVWGQLSALCVELISIGNDGWVYLTTYSWNPVLFRARGYGVTLLPQLIWLLAPVLYYFGALFIPRRAREHATRRGRAERD